MLVVLAHVSTAWFRMRFTCLERQKRYPAGTSNSTNVRLTGQNSKLFQWLALQLLFAADKDSLPTDSGVLLSQFACTKRGSA
jgi:hypothetical protein